jgi:resuscitation-promoting factor RpfB
MSDALPPAPPTKPPTTGARGNSLLKWASAHKVWTAIIILVVIGVIGSAASGGGTPPPPPPSTSPPSPVMVEVPAVVGKNVASATTKLQGVGLEVETSKKFSHEPAGTVLRISVKEGTEVVEGSTVSLVVAKPFPKVPSVVGLSEKKAKSKLKAAGYELSITKKTSSVARAGTVISSSPSAGSELLPGKTVKLVVAKAATPPTNNCTPGYSPCLPLGPSDYDCYGGSGNGPAYTKQGVTYRVTGSDPYDLDSDNDGYGCE